MIGYSYENVSWDDIASLRAEGAAAERARIEALLETLHDAYDCGCDDGYDGGVVDGVHACLAAVRSASLSPSVGEDAAHE